MPIIPFGIKNVGHKKSDHQRMAITFNVQVNTAVNVDGPATVINIPGTILQITGWQFELDPLSQQNAAQFGEVLSLQITLDRFASFFVSALSEFIAGRIFIVIPSTGEIFEFSPKEIFPGAALSGGYDSVSCLINSIASAPGKIKVYIEQDTEAPPHVGGTRSQATVIVTVFNYQLPPVSFS